VLVVAAHGDGLPDVEGHEAEVREPPDLAVVEGRRVEEEVVLGRALEDARAVGDGQVAAAPALAREEALADGPLTP
jgi:hypothetical protein